MSLIFGAVIMGSIAAVVDAVLTNLRYERLEAETEAKEGVR